MAEKRMFAKTIIDSDAFLDMPLSTQALYFHLSMRADDDGFINNPKRIVRMINANDDDLRVLITKRFVLVFDSGVIVIKHWRLHNTLRKDRYKPTIYQEEFKQLSLKKDGGYTDRLPSGCQMVTKRLPNGNQEDAVSESEEKDESKEINGLDYGCQSGNQVATQNRIDKNRLDKNTNKQLTHTEAIEPSVDESVCCVSSHEDCFDEGEDFDAPVKVQAEQKQLEHLQDTVDETKPLTLVELITACKTFGIRLSHTPKTEAIANRNTVTLVVLRECAKTWKATSTGTGYFVGILDNASKDPQSILPHEKREKPELSAETISDKQAGYFASQLVHDPMFCSKYAKGFQDYGVFASHVAANLRNPRYFDEYKPHLQRLGFM